MSELNVMTPEEFEKKMKEISENEYYKNNLQYWHEEADEQLCNLLRSLGYGKGVDLFEQHNKWYA